jgi:hypothetical protein
VSELVFLLEEPSAKDLLEGLVPRLLPPDWSARFIPFQGKQDLERRMSRFLRAWQNPSARFVVLRDQDSGNCEAVKRGLVERCAEAGRHDVLVRVACRELESWIVGDLDAFSEEFKVAAAAKAKRKAKFRNPDLLGSPMGELRSFVPTYQKRDGARRMGTRLDPGQNESTSFRNFCSGIVRLLSGGVTGGGLR